MTIYLILLSSLIDVCLYSQSKGVTERTPSPHSGGSWGEGCTVIIGISDYKYKSIPDDGALLVLA